MLRQDNADTRLSEIGYQVGLLSPRNFQRFKAKQKAIHDELARLESTRFGGELLSQLLKRPEICYQDLPCRNESLSKEVTDQVETEIKYAGYVSRQEQEIETLKSLEHRKIPIGVDYHKIPGLRSEARLKLNKIRPTTLGQASRISGVSPSDIGIVMVWMKRSANPADVRTR
jgi:tRNA uridine 5-carboxymethylaminomethyl modification enzyme